MEKWTTLLTIPMALLSAIGQVNIFNSMARPAMCLRTPFGFTGASLLANSHIAVQYGGGNDVRYLAGAIDF